jgi:16S rRNA (guanine527-N7)-methyltransferase
VEKARFHVEQNEMLSAEIRKKLSFTNEQADKLNSYAQLIHEENRKYNLAGHKTLEEIIENLILGSILPVKKLIVPRGTIFADLGTGAGIPGIPLAVYIEKSQGVLFDSNSKKIRFIESAAAECGINNIKTVNCRIEEAGKNNEYRKSFDWVFSRAMADIYTACELGAPLLKRGGKLFLYSREKELVRSPEFIKHLDNLGLKPESEESGGNKQMETLKAEEEGILLKNIRPCPHEFPRRIAVIRRESDKIRAGKQLRV